GSKAAAPGVPTPQGVDDSIQTYGLEAPSPQRVQASLTLQRYLNAKARSNWGSACTYLSRALQSQLSAMAKGAGAGDCAATMAAFSANIPSALLRKAAQVKVLSLRAKGDHAYLIYADGEGTVAQFPMVRQGGAWAVGAIAGSALLLE